MARRRPPRAFFARLSNRTKFHRAVCEALEDRQLLTTLHGGDTFTFRAPDKNLVSVVVGGLQTETTINVIGFRINNETGAQLVGDLPGQISGPDAGAVSGVTENGLSDPGIQPDQQKLPPTPPPPPNGGPDPYATRPPYYADTIFHIDVTQSDANSFITIQEFDANSGAALGFRSSIGQLHITTRGTVDAPANTGPVLFGARTITLTQATNDPKVLQPPPVIPDIPIASANGVTAGLTIAAGNDFGNFLLGGTMLGQVSIGGSIDTFYAGWLLVGSSWAGGPGFTVAGNLNNLYSKGSIGTDNAALTGGDLLDTGFDLHVGGRLGMVRTLGDFMGTSDVTAGVNLPGVAANNPVTETEAEVRDAAKGASTNELGLGLLGDDPTSYNDTFNTPQILMVNQNGTASVNGSLTGGAVADFVDYYGISVMSGQTITVRLNAPSFGVDVGVFDPDGRLVATDYNKTDPTFTELQPFQVTIDKPGLWRFAVAGSGNTTFSNTAGGPTIAYNLFVQNLGDVSFGGILANNIVRVAGPGNGIHDALGDVGAIVGVGGLLRAEENFSVDQGNLRAVQATSIGTAMGQNDLEAVVPNGSIGLISATSASGVLSFNTNPLLGPIGGNLDIASAAGTLGGLYHFDGGIGVVRAATIPGGSDFHVNYDATNNHDGIIDLIDVTGDFGDAANGGPAIATGPGGNVRYLHVGGSVYRDPFFGSGTPEGTLYQVGEAVDIVDDSGTVVHITPSAGIADPANPGQYTTQPGQLTITAYGIEGSGGSAIVKIVSSGGVTVTGDANNTFQTAEVGEIDATGTGTAVIATPTPTPVTSSGGGTTGANGGNGVDTTLPQNTSSIGGQGNTSAPGFPGPGQPGGPPIKTTTTTTSRFPQLPAAPELSPTGGQSLDVVADGNTRVDFYSVTGGNFTNVVNKTSGEIVNVNATSIGTLASKGTIGLTQSYLGEDVNGASTFSNAYPFNQQHYGITASTGIVSVTAPRYGNIVAGSLGIGSLNGTDAGPVVSGGAVQSVNLGSGGMVWAGSGNLGRSGIYAVGVIGPVTSTGDIRGNLISQTGIQGVNVSGGGSLIGAQLGHYAAYDSALPFVGVLESSGDITPITKPTYDIVGASVSGNGGIIGSFFAGNHIGSLQTNGFGIFDSDFVTAGDGTVDSVIGGGYGIRYGTFAGGSLYGNIIAVGDGSNVPTTNFATSVRGSQNGGAFDPTTGQVFSPLNDINVALGVSGPTFQSLGTTTTGAIADVTLQANRNVGLISAYSISSNDVTVGGVTYAEQTFFNIQNQVKTIQVAGTIQGLLMTTGRIQNFRVGGDVSGLNATFAGSIGKLVFNSNLDSGSVLQVVGRNAHIGTVTVKGNMAGTISAITFIQNINIGGSVTGTIQANSVKNIHIAGNLADGGLTIDGAVQNLIFDGDAGATGNVIRINGSMNTLKVGGNLLANVAVLANLNKLMVNGSIISGSTTTVGNVLTLLQVGQDVQAGAVVQAHVIKRQKIGGQVLGSILTV